MSLESMTESGMDPIRVAELPPHASPAAQEEEISIDLVELLHKLRQGRWTIFWSSLVCLAIATAIAFLLPIHYTSVASFVPPNLGGSSSMASALAGQLSTLGAGDLLGGVKSSGDLYAGILKSRSIAQEVVDKNNLRQVYREKTESRAEKMLGSATAVTVDTKSSIITVAVTDKDPHRAQKLAGDYMDALQETNGRLALSQSSQRRLFFERQLAHEKDDLENAEVEMKMTEEKSGLIAPTGQTESEIRTIAEMQAQIAVRQVQLAALRQSATEENPEVIRLKSEVTDLEGQLAGMQNGGGKSTMAAIPTSKVPELQLEYVRKEREVKYHEALFEMLSRQYEAARLDESRDAPALQVLDAASYPDTKSSPKRSYYMLGGLLAGFFCGCVWVLVRERVHGMHAALTGGEAA
jgi:uncharacterized protein involved in exopolysaccharide biosynthesis